MAVIAVSAWLAQAVLVSAVAEETDGNDAPATEQATADPIPDDPPPATPVTALELLQKSRDSLVYTRTSVNAKLREQVAIAGNSFEASGTYEAGVFPKLRLTFQTDVGKSRGALLEVCDGQLLWTVQEVQVAGNDAPSVKISRTVIADVLNAWGDNLDSPEAVLTAKLGVGGLPALLAALERSMVFDAVKLDEHRGQPFSVIQGRWNDDYLARFGGADGKPLPDYVPDRVRIYFDQQTLFPTRILYLKKARAEARLPFQLLLSLEFSDIVLDGPVNDEQFRYAPPDEAQVENRTSKILGLIEASKKPSTPAGDSP
ncbi:MAG: hypothetical protein AB7U20_18855 [Planctomycetaceae bacterium]